MVNERELLESAAKAAGMYVLPIPWPRDADAGWFYNPHNNGGGLFALGSLEKWNPLTDDGDALRLAVKLGFEVYQSQHPYPRASVWCGDGPFLNVDEKHGSDPYAATRLAIVRAAAALAGDA